MKNTLIAVLATLSASGAAVVGAPPTFEVVVLKSLGGHSTSATDLNESGVVVGKSQYVDGLSHATVWMKGKITDLGTLGGPDSRTSAVNNANQIVGSAEDSNGDEHAVLWTFDGKEWTITDLGMFDGLETKAWDVSETGLIVGFSHVSSIPRHALVWEDGKMTVLPDLIEGSRSSAAQGVNSRNQIAGSSSAADGHAHAVIWEKRGGKWLIIELGHFDEQHSAAGAWINDHGDVAGDWFTPSRRGFIYADGVFTDLGEPPEGSSVLTYAINNSGWVVGKVSDYGGFLWINGDLHQLSDLVIPPQRDRVNAYGVNEAGVIVGSRGCCGGPFDAVVLIPINIGDLDNDGDVDGADLIVLLGAWGACGDCNNCPADLDGDCVVGASDLIILLGNWG